MSAIVSVCGDRFLSVLETSSTFDSGVSVGCRLEGQFKIGVLFNKNEDITGVQKPSVKLALHPFCLLKVMDIKWNLVLLLMFISMTMLGETTHKTYHCGNSGPWPSDSVIVWSVGAIPSFFTLFLAISQSFGIFLHKTANFCKIRRSRIFGVSSAVVGSSVIIITS